VVNDETVKVAKVVVLQGSEIVIVNSTLSAAFAGAKLADEPPEKAELLAIVTVF